MYAYSVPLDDGMIFYILEEQEDKRRRKSEFELELEKSLEQLDKLAEAMLGAGGIPVKVPRRLPSRLRR
jgi:hypothetical protein